MTTHLGIMVLFAALLSTVFATLSRDAARDQLRFGLQIFAGLVAGANVLGWLMYFVFG
jgi:hypothetical protein